MNKLSEKLKTIIYNCIKKNKVPRNKKTKEMKDLYIENCKRLRKKLKREIRYSMIMDWKN